MQISLILITCESLVRFNTKVDFRIESARLRQNETMSHGQNPLTREETPCFCSFSSLLGACPETDSVQKTTFEIEIIWSINNFI